MRVRPAGEPDLDAVSALHDREVREGVATFDLEPRPRTAWQERLSGQGPGDHLIVAETDDRSLLGYASAAAYRPHGGYRHTRETTVYVAPGGQGAGVGRALYAELLARLDDDGVHLALAAIALPNPASRALHRASGFEPVGVMREVGRKFDRWLDVEWWQRLVR